MAPSDVTVAIVDDDRHDGGAGAVDGAEDIAAEIVGAEQILRQRRRPGCGRRGLDQEVIKA